MRNFLLLLVFSLFFALTGNGQESKICGLSIVAPPSPFPNDYTVEVKQVNANWVAIIPYAGGPPGKTDILFNMNGQWWGETKDGVRESIRLAHEAGLKVMLKPQVWFPGSWPGALDFRTEGEWEKWEENYTAYINFHADIACEMEVEMICIGTEFTKSETKREAFWRGLIRSIRMDYKGKLTYASNWDAYKDVPFWDELDYIGVDAYFPLDESRTPGKKRLHKLWQPVHKELKAVHQKFSKPILFTEFGYMSIDGCAGKTWELEAKMDQIPVNEEAQAVALEGMFSFFEKQDYWQGGFLWKWYPYQGYYLDHKTKDYSPQNKEAEKTVRYWYQKFQE